MPEEKLSFISQKTFNPPVYKSAGPGVLLIFSFLIFFLSGSLAIGLFFYKNSLKKEIDSMNDSLVSARAAFELPVINKLINISDKISSVKKLLAERNSLIPIFDLLESTTLKDVRFKNFKYSTSEKNFTVVLDGTTKNYSVLAAQSDIFEKEKDIKEVLLSNFNLGEKGVVNFMAKIVFDPELVVYKSK